MRAILRKAGVKPGLLSRIAFIGEVRELAVASAKMMVKAGSLIVTPKRDPACFSVRRFLYASARRASS